MVYTVVQLDTVELDTDVVLERIVADTVVQLHSVGLDTDAVLEHVVVDTVP